MSFIGDAMKTIESVILLRSKVERLDEELMRTNDDLRRVIGTVVQMNGRLIRLETIEEMRSGATPPPMIDQ
ncbi:MAG: hypothetical protein M3R64_11935 [Pseudomonadota bacterium]|nr:hypothetical protein [Pseudomonadota bacterium]